MPYSMRRFAIVKWFALFLAISLFLPGSPAYSVEIVDWQKVEVVKDDPATVELKHLLKRKPFEVVKAAVGDVAYWEGFKTSAKDAPAWLLGPNDDLVFDTLIFKSHWQEGRKAGGQFDWPGLPNRGPPILVAGPLPSRLGFARTSVDSSNTPLLDKPGMGSAVGAYSVRLLRAGYTGDCCRVRRGSDNKEMDFAFDGGWLTANSIGNDGSDPATNGQTLSTFCSATDGFLVTMYEQSGGAAGNATQTTAGNQPRIVASGVLVTLNGKAAVDAVSSDTVVSVNNTGITGNAAVTMSIVYSADAQSVRSPFGFGSVGGALQAMGPIYGLVNANKVSVAFAGGNNFNDSATWSVSTQYSLIITKTAGAINTTTTVYKNAVAGSDAGSSSTGTPSITSDKFAIGRWASSVSEHFDGQWQEAILWNSTTPSPASIYSDQDQAFNIP